MIMILAGYAVISLAFGLMGVIRYRAVADFFKFALLWPALILLIVLNLGYAEGECRY